MTYYGAREMAESFRTVRNNTIKVAEEIPEDKYGFTAASGIRSVGQMLIHIAIATRFPYQIHGLERRGTLVGLDLPALLQDARAEERKIRSKMEILEMLHNGRDKFAGWLEGLSSEFLGERVNMLPGALPASKTRFEMILSVKEHEMHHRAQLMLIERLLGIVPHLTRDREARLAGLNPAKA